MNFDKDDIESKEIIHISYDIDYLLNRAYKSIDTTNKNIKLQRPKIEKKDRKTYITNFNDICKCLNRTCDNVKLFLTNELQLSTSVKEDGRLKIDGMKGITQQRIESLMQGYITKYVMCRACKSCKTIEQKINRVDYLMCDTCKSKYAL